MGQKVGRNDPCYCGSGRKYKKCHFDTDQKAEYPSSGAALDPRVQKLGPTIRVAAQGWGDGVQQQDVTKVLESAAEALWAHIQDVDPPVIHVSRLINDDPITLFERGSNGEIRIKLNVSGPYWAQFAYQFGHEFLHVLGDGKRALNPNLWFEETLCEAASLYTLRQMADSWKKVPPHPRWADFSASLLQYRENRIAEARLPDGTVLADWFRSQEAALRSGASARRHSKEQRDIYLVMAREILPMFEANPQHWDAVKDLNRVLGDGARSFSRYLGDWSRSVPEMHRAFVRKIADLFGVSIE